MKKIQLPNVTLFAVACTKVEETIFALKKSMEGIQFARAILITHEKIDLSSFGIEVYTIEKLDYKGYNHFILYRAYEYIQTEYSLLVQNDGYILHPKQWDPVFLQYDYIGAPWESNIHFTEGGKNIRIGNGGFSLRSKKLLNLFSEKPDLSFTDNNTGFFHEDGVISVYHRTKLESYGIQFAPVSIASRFSRETVCGDSVYFPFGFHNKRSLSWTIYIRVFLKKIGITI